MPHAIMVIESIVFNIDDASVPKSSGVIALDPVTISRVAANAPGCSKISFCM